MTQRPFLVDQDARRRYTQARIKHWDGVARKFRNKRHFAAHYHRRLREIYGNLVTPGQRVLELGCGAGELLATFRPSLGVGVDFSAEMVRQASQRLPEHHFVQADALDFTPGTKFDVIILSDLVNDLWDVQAALETAARAADPHTRLILNFYSRVWEPVLWVAARLGLANSLLPQNWLTLEEMNGLLELTGFEVVRTWREVLLPVGVPGIHQAANKVLVRFWPLYHLALTNFMLARPRRSRWAQKTEPQVSVVVPVRNEAGNIAALFRRMPELGRGTEMIFVEGHSTDGSYEAIQGEIETSSGRHCSLYRQPGVGKGDAVRYGLAQANGEILMIMDADLSVPPESLLRFYQAVLAGAGELVNGVRLTYPVEGEAMRFLNLIGNKLFSLVLTWMIGQPIKDTLCGTKTLWKSDYLRIMANRKNISESDPFGDFDLIFGAAKLNLKILDLPIRYQPRTYGKTNISRWQHGWLLLKMTVVAARRIRFV